MFDVKKIKKDFPMLQGKKMRDHPLVYLDNASTTFKPYSVIEAISSYYEEHTGNAHRGDYDLCFELDQSILSVREKVAKFINADLDEVVFTYGTTSSISLISMGYCLDNLVEGDEIILNAAEHASDSLPWFDLQRRKGVKLVFAQLEIDGSISLDSIKNAVTSRTRLIAVALISNVLGTLAPVKEICSFAHEHNILVAVDGAQGVPHLKTDVKDLGCDFLSFSGHKMLGPTGVGILYGKKELLNKMGTVITGGGNNVSFNDNGEVKYLNAPMKFEAGTLNISGILGLGAAIDYLNDVGMDNIAKHEIELKKYAVEKLSQNKDLIIYNPETPSGIVTFNVKGVFSQDVATYLNNQGIAVRSGLHCAKMLPNKIGADSTVRASFYLYTAKEDIDALAEALQHVKGDFLNVYFS